MRSLQPGGAAVRRRHVVGMLLAQALLGLLLGLFAAIASHAGGTRTAQGATREPVWTADHQVHLNPASSLSDVFQTFQDPDPDLAVGFGRLALLSFGRLTGWSRS
jgi:ferric-dicitrate binding protein FerR (iron transport regulator)